MERRTKRELFLVLTTIGTFLCLVGIAVGLVLAFKSFPVVIHNVVSWNASALRDEAEKIAWPAIIGSGVFLGTWISYRRYQGFLDD